jgi:hypothetical protein
MSPSRDQRLETTTAAKTAFLLASCQLRFRDTEGVGQSFLGLLPGALKQNSSVCQLSPVFGGSMNNDFAQHLHTHLFVGDSVRPDRCPNFN